MSRAARVAWIAAALRLPVVHRDWVLTAAGGLVGGCVVGAWLGEGWAGGNLAEWGGAIGTVGALLVGGFALRRQLRQFAAADADRSKELEHLQAQVEAAQRQQVIARDALRASVRPLLVPPWSGSSAAPESANFADMQNPVTTSAVDTVVFVSVDDADHPARVSVPVVNVGSGPALVRGLGVRAAGAPEVGWRADISRSVLAVGEGARVNSSVPPDRPELSDLWESVRRQSNFIVSVRYTNATGDDDLRSEMHIHGGRIRQVLFYEADAREPFASTAPADA